MDLITIALAGLYIGVVAFLMHWLDRGSRAAVGDNPGFAEGTEEVDRQDVEVDRQDVNIIALSRGRERYVWLYDDAHAPDAIATAHRFARDPSLSFSDDDCRLICDRIRQRLRSGHA